jgi:predicted N-acyltransferase
LSKVFRKNLRRKFKALEKVPPLELEVLTDATHLVDEIFPLYMQTFQRSEFKFEELTKEYFCLMGQIMPERSRYFIWRQAGRIVAFSLCQVHEGILYDLDVGLDYAVALDLHLYFVTWRDIIQWGLANGVKRYHTGPLNYDPKLHLRMKLAPQDLYARHASPWINPIFGIAIEYLQPARHNATLAQFANANEM